MPKKEIAQPTGPARNPFVVFNPPLVDARNMQSGNQTTSKTLSPNPGDGPPVASQAAETLGKIGKNGKRIPSRPGDSVNMFMREQEDGENAIRRYLLKRRQDWFYRIDESTDVKLFCEKLQEFIEYAAGYLALENIPEVTLKDKLKNNTFATWSEKGIQIAISERHPMDVFRSVAHELVHQKQHEEDELHAESGQTGSEHENEANAMAGIIMRNFAKHNPKLFELESIVSEGLLGAIFGKKPSAAAPVVKKTKAHPLEVMHARADLEKMKHKNKLELIQARSKSSGKVSKSAGDAHTGSGFKVKIAGNDFEINQPDHEQPNDATLSTFEKAKEAFRNHPDIKAKIDSQKTAAVKDKTVKGLKYHQDWLDTQKKFPTKKNAPGVKTFSNILKIKEAIALLNKSNKSNIPYGVLREVFFRGVDDWSSSYKLTKEQHAFNRVDSFIAGGRAHNLDKDLEEQING